MMEEQFSEDKFKEEVIDFIDENIRPSLMLHGGNIAVKSFDKLDNGQYQIGVKLQGACGSCPHAQMTMKMGVERNLLENFSQIDSVIAV